MARGDVETLRILADVIRDRLVVQRDAIERMETKAVFLLGVAVTAAQFVITADGLNPWWQGFALAAYGLSFIYGLVVVAPYRHNYPPEPKVLFEEYHDSSPRAVLNVLAATRAVAFEINVKAARRKTKAWWRTLVLLVVAVALSGVAAVSGSSSNGDNIEHPRGTERPLRVCSHDQR